MAMVWEVPPAGQAKTRRYHIRGPLMNHRAVAHWGGSALAVADAGLRGCHARTDGGWLVVGRCK
jgi:hypothetical protein